MNKPLTLGSLFDGSGAFPLAGLLAGIKPVWSSEIEPFPIRVTEKRLPFVKHYGDISKLSGAEPEPVDIITFGSPCQDLSVAGKRAGLQKGERSSLFFQAIRIIKEMRCKTNGEYPRYIVFENVGGALSSNSGDDFRCVLEEICKVKDDSVSVPKSAKWTKSGEIVGDDFSLAWRVLDAQYWGVAQRRKRIFLVADFASECAGNILFESESLSGYSAEGFRAWQRAAGSIEDGSGASGEYCMCDQGGERIDILNEKTATLRAEAHHPPCILSAGFCTEHSAKARGIGYEEETSPTLRAGVVPAAIALENHPADSRVTIAEDDVCQTLTSRCGTGGGNVPLLLDTPIAYGICSKDSNSMKSSNPNSGIYEASTNRTIDGNGGNPACNQGGIVVLEGNGSRPSHHGNGYKQSETMYTLNATENHGVSYGIDRAAFNQGQNARYNIAIEEELEPTIVAKGPGAVAHTFSTSKASFFTRAEEELANTLVATDYKDPPVVNDMADMEYIVRRLTPQECALLMGMPTWWCQGLASDNPTEKEIDRWTKIFEDYRLTVKPDTKPKTRKQIIKWLQKPHSDSAEYTMWGNGVCLPNAWFVLAGIAYYAQNESK